MRVAWEGADPTGLRDLWRQVKVKDRSVITTAAAETRVMAPVQLQPRIDAAVTKTPAGERLSVPRRHTKACANARPVLGVHFYHTLSCRGSACRSGFCSAFRHGGCGARVC